MLKHGVADVGRCRLVGASRPRTAIGSLRTNPLGSSGISVTDICMGSMVRSLRSGIVWPPPNPIRLKMAWLLPCTHPAADIWRAEHRDRGPRDAQLCGRVWCELHSKILGGRLGQNLPPSWSEWIRWWSRGGVGAIPPPVAVAVRGMQ